MELFKEPYTAVDTTTEVSRKDIEKALSDLKKFFPEWSHGVESQPQSGFGICSRYKFSDSPLPVNILRSGGCA